MGLYLFGVFGAGIGLLMGGRDKFALRGRDTHKDRISHKQKPFFLHLALSGVTIQIKVRSPSKHKV